MYKLGKPWLGTTEKVSKKDARFLVQAIENVPINIVLVTLMVNRLASLGNRTKQLIKGMCVQILADIPKILVTSLPYF